STRAPMITLAAPADMSTLALGANLAGSATSASATIVALNYKFDAGTPQPITFDPTLGTFNQPLDQSRLSAGAHTLTVTAVDSAGNPASKAVNVDLASAIPFSITSVAPLDGAGDVGVTFRPKVIFSRPVDPTTLNASDFFATGPSGDTIPAKIVPADDGSF